MSESKGHVLNWLRDAHAMERQAEQMLRGEIARIEHYPDLKKRMEEQLERNLSQQKKVEQCIERLGGKPSAIKDIGAQAVAFGQTLSGVVVGDEVVKGAMSLYVFVNMEIASYRILIAAAEHVGDNETRDICQDILSQEIDLSVWLLERLPELTDSFLERADAGLDAKR